MNLLLHYAVLLTTTVSAAYVVQTNVVQQLTTAAVSPLLVHPLTLQVHAHPVSFLHYQMIKDQSTMTLCIPQTLLPMSIPQPRVGSMSRLMSFPF